MRYIGSKESITGNILKLLQEKDLLRQGLTFFDSFCGMGSVSNAVKDYYRIEINDILRCCTTFTAAKLLGKSIQFDNLPFNPFYQLNSDKTVEKGFFYNNYSPANSDRMYFTPENAGRIDFFRHEIQAWYDDGTITKEQYIYLLGCLLDAVSKVSNTAGVYGAFLKKWDHRAYNKIAMSPLFYDDFFNDHKAIDVNIHNDRIEDIISDVDCDILYLDPPYTQNQYGTQYHLLETLVLNDNPNISKITGSRPVTPLRSDWSKKNESHILLDYVLAKTKARYVILSYNNDGFMSKDFIEASFKRYGKEDSYTCKAIDYKKYNNKKCQGSDGHVEYLFFVEKKSSCKVVYESPLNYTGSKSKMVGFIKDNLPQTKIDTFVDAFGGGFNVGVNIDGSVIYNDINYFVEGLLQSFRDVDTLDYLKGIDKLIQKYNLSPNNSEAYNRIRADYNSQPLGKRDPIMLYTTILYGFQQQIRFNGSHDFNNPSGSRYFNDKLLEKFISFSREIKEKQVNFETGSYDNLRKYVKHGSFFYFDPPYTNTLGVYNDGKRGFLGWTKEKEHKLLSFINEINGQGVSFMLSFIIRNGDTVNEDIMSWQENNNYHIIEVPKPQGRYNNRSEVLIKNY
ncbi:MAG: DNA adenine methylase [Prevotella sp.]|nr:DNA adenine methylase [Bacteroidales bacterium]MDY4228560.1 DNA adenine methylase [Prevotella sp.]